MSRKIDNFELALAKRCTRDATVHDSASSEADLVGPSRKAMEQLA
jgi:hypothetical protein